MGLVTTFLGGRESRSRLPEAREVSRAERGEMRATALHPRTVSGPSQKRWAKCTFKSVDSRLQPEALPLAEGKVITWKRVSQLGDGLTSSRAGVT